MKITKSRCYKKSTTKKGRYFQKDGSKTVIICRSGIATILNKKPQNAIL